MNETTNSATETPRRTASLTLVRPGDSNLEVFWARRRSDRDFLGGFHAFFAGGVEAGDAELPVDTPEAEDARLRAAALRECLEESGLLLTTETTRRIDSKPRRPDALLSPTDSLATSRLQRLGWWQTPGWMNPIFSTVFFAVVLTEKEGRRFDDLGDHLDSDEFDSGAWISASEALRRWERARALTTSPVRAILRAVVDANGDTEPRFEPPQLGPSMDHPGTAEWIELCGGVVFLPLQTPTLPPATHTNAYVVGREKFVVIDPGPAGDDALAPLCDHLRRRLDDGDRCIGVVLTHHHRDHSGGAESISDRVDAPVLAHPDTFARLDDLSSATDSLSNGDTLATDHPGPLECIHTPGHAPGHLAIAEPNSRLVFAGDLVATEGTILIDPPDGHMGDYLDSLDRLRRQNPRYLFPAHGPPSTDPRALLDYYLEHRKMREKKILQALRQQGPSTPSDLVAHAYDDAPRHVWPLAQRSLLAHLIHLVELDLAIEADDVFKDSGQETGPNL